MILELLGRYAPEARRLPSSVTRRPVEPDDMLDEWAAGGIERPEDIKTLYADRFWFGCEADDPLTSLAFNTSVNPFGAELQVMLGSDVAHWDLPDMTEVLEEAYEMVERGWIGEASSRDVVFINPARLVDDMPGGGVRPVADSRGIDHVVVAGVEVVPAGVATVARPGRVLRPGTDTDTVTLADVRR